jgi:ubiquinone/menaquinone biosynthesis C-methylase UbiE
MQPVIYEDPEQLRQAEERRRYWDQGWEHRVSAGDTSALARLGPEEWGVLLDQLRAGYGAERHARMVEAGPEAVRGKIVLDIGCGSGVSGPFFHHAGARYIGVDISAYAARTTRTYIQTLGGRALTVQADSQALPLRSGSIDLVFSDGVLHHTPNTELALAEIHRVLRPGGRAVIGLYATESLKWRLQRWDGWLHGRWTASAYQRWLSRETEHSWRTGQRKNPWTKTYSRPELQAIFSRITGSDITLRKACFQWADIPVLGKLMKIDRWRRWAEPYQYWLAPWWGAMWFVSYTKAPSGNS